MSRDLAQLSGVAQMNEQRFKTNPPSGDLSIAQQQQK